MHRLFVIVGVTILSLTSTIHAQNAMEFLLAWGNYGTGLSEFQNIGDIANDIAGNTYVLDRFSGSVKKFAPDGSLISIPVTTGFLITNLAIGRDGTIFVNDYDGHRIVKYSAGGLLLMTFGES
jgi:hypothetical protein